MGDLTKAKISQENVSDSRQLTTLIKELQNSMRSLQSVDDYLTRVSKAKEILGNDLDTLSDDIDKKKTDLNDSLIQMGRFVSSVLDSIEITEDELDSAAEQLVLFTQGKDDAITYAKKELKAQVEDSYWHKYWTGVVQRLTSLSSGINSFPIVSIVSIISSELGDIKSSTTSLIFKFL